tara:strand:- start:488 stop:1066 length:579 start_codon:yes stop_codon:yes gene_type:complete
MKKIYFSKHEIFSTQITNNKINISKIIKEFKQNSDKYHYTHFINNRWENIYLSPSDAPSILPLLSNLQSIALSLYSNTLSPHQTLIIPHDLLGYEKNEFWFNLSEKGQSTRIHNHKEQSNISGVFYLQVPKNSPNLFFKDEKDTIEIQVKEGMVVFFPSKLDHYVPENKNDSTRISIAFNCYIFPLMFTTNN